MSKAKTLAVSVSDAGALVNSVPTSSVGSVLTLKEATANGTNILELKAPATLANDVAFTLPDADGTGGQVLSTDGSGTLSWVALAGGLAYVVKTANYTTQNNEGVLADTSGGAFTVTLPATPSTGDQVVVADPTGDWGTNNLTVARNGETIAGVAQDLVCDISGASVQLVYDGTTWAVYAQVGGNGGTAVTLNGTQTLTNKTINGSNNTITNVSLSTGVTGTLPEANGGTGITSFGTGVATFLGTPSSANLASAVTDETGSGALVFATSPTLVTPALGTPASGNLESCTADGTNAVGFKTIPQNVQTGNYTLVLADSGKHIYRGSGSAATWTIPANGSVAYPVGTALTFINYSATSVSIAITTDTMRLSPAGTTGTRTLAQYGSATAIKVDSTNWIISGSGLT
jgi:hypothetical protein